jgi:hypothetical protein
VTPPGWLTKTGGWGLWVSATGRWWAAYGSVLTPRQIDAGCAPLVYSDDAEGLATRLREQEILRHQHPADPGAGHDPDCGPHPGYGGTSRDG